MIKTPRPAKGTVRSLQLQSKPEALRQELAALAQRLGPGAKLPKVMDLSRDFNVSTATLHRVLGELGDENILIRRHGVGIFVNESMKPQKEHVALVCDPSFFRTGNHSVFWDILLEQTQQLAAEETDLECHFATPENPQSLLQPDLQNKIAHGQIDGMLGIALNGATADWIMEQGVPLAQLFGPGHAVINRDMEAFISQAVAMVAAKSCQRIGLWLPVSPERPARDYREHNRNFVSYFKAALAAQGLDFDATLVRSDAEALGAGPTSVVPSLSEQGFSLVREVFSSATPPPEGILILDDTMTRGALTGLQKLKLQAGADVQLATFANARSPVLLGHENELNLLEFDWSQFAQLLLAELKSLMSGALPAEPRERRIAPRAFGAAPIHF